MDIEEIRPLSVHKLSTILNITENSQMKTRLDVILETVSELLEANRGTMFQRAGRALQNAGGPGTAKGKKFLRALRRRGFEDTARQIVQDYGDAQAVERGVDAAKAARER